MELIVWIDPNWTPRLVVDMPVEPNMLDYMDAHTTKWVAATRKYNDAVTLAKETAIPVRNPIHHLLPSNIEIGNFYEVFCSEFEVTEIRDMEGKEEWGGKFKQIAVIREVSKEGEAQNRKEPKTRIRRSRPRK